MPFISKAQQRWMFSQHPKMAKEWASKTDFSKLPYHVAKKKLKVKGKTKPGDLLKAYKKKVDNKAKGIYGEVDEKNKTAFINKKLSKEKPTHKRPAKKGASKYPEVKDSAYHERLHMLYPKMTEQEVYKKTHKAMRTIGKKESKKLYNLFK